MKGIDGVEIASPVLSISVLGKQKGYEGYLRLKGITLDAINKMNLPVAQGELRNKVTPLKIIAGYAANQNFTIPKGMSGGGGMMVMGGEAGRISILSTSRFSRSLIRMLISSRMAEGAKDAEKIPALCLHNFGEQTNGEYDWNICGHPMLLKDTQKGVQ